MDMLLYVVLPALPALWLITQACALAEQEEDRSFILLALAGLALCPGIALGHLASLLTSIYYGFAFNPAMPIALVAVFLCNRARE